MESLAEFCAKIQGMRTQKDNVFLNQILPLGLTLIIFTALSGLLWIAIRFLNFLPHTEISLILRPRDVLFGLTIYLKTSVDFAIFIANLIKVNPGYKSRIAVEISTALGNAVGTILILTLWILFRNLDWLLGLMVFLASLVLLRMAEDGLDHIEYENVWIKKFAQIIKKPLGAVNKIIDPILGRVIPKMSMTGGGNLSFWSLFGLAFTVPFILGLDDFAGYVPLFSIVNIFGFSVGVFLGHMVLNILLYLSPAKTVRAVSYPLISLLGSLVFIGLAIYGFIEVGKIIAHLV